jgi:hypothetical protein
MYMFQQSNCKDLCKHFFPNQTMYETLHKVRTSYTSNMPKQFHWLPLSKHSCNNNQVAGLIWASPTQPGAGWGINQGESGNGRAGGGGGGAVGGVVLCFDSQLGPTREKQQRGLFRWKGMVLIPLPPLTLLLPPAPRGKAGAEGGGIKCTSNH